MARPRRQGLSIPNVGSDEEKPKPEPATRPRRAGIVQPLEPAQPRPRRAGVTSPEAAVLQSPEPKPRRVGSGQDNTGRRTGVANLGSNSSLDSSPKTSSADIKPRGAGSPKTSLEDIKLRGAGSPDRRRVGSVDIPTVANARHSNGSDSGSEGSKREVALPDNVNLEKVDRRLGESLTCFIISNALSLQI